MVLSCSQNQKVEKEIYYRFSYKDNIKFRFDKDYILSFFSMFAISIKSKLRGINNVGILQSSGLDSNSLLYFISNEMKYRHQKVNTYTACNSFSDKIDPKYHPYISDEQLFKKSLVQYDNVNAKFLDFHEVNFEDEFIDSLADYDFPIVTKSKFWLKGIIGQAKKDGVQLLFTGQLGNYTITWNQPNELINQVLRIRLLYAFKEIKIIARHTKNSVFKVFKTHIITPLKSFIKFRLNLFLNYKLKGIDNSIFFLRPIEKDVNLKSVYSKENTVLIVPRILNPHKLRELLLNINAELTGSRWYSTGFERSLLVNDPTIDIRVLEFLFALPSKQYFSQGKQKTLFRKTFNERIFAPILYNDFTIQQSFDLCFRLHADSFFRKYFDRFRNKNVGDGLFDLKKLEKEYNELLDKRTDLQKYIAAINFLKRFSIMYLYMEYDEKSIT
jgi:asparagine synthase (glutamine-hydrolysing)